MSESFELDGFNVTIDNIPDFAKGSTTFRIAPKAKVRIQKARDYVLKVVDKGDPVYGINTGYGALSSENIDKDDIASLQLNFIRSHCVGVGNPMDRVMVRAMMLIQVQSLLKGHSGVQVEVVERLVDFLNHDITPVVPEKGSVGASGDLAPLAHVAHCLIGEGQVIFEGAQRLSSEVMKEYGLDVITMGPKDGLGLCNGTHLMCAQAVLAIDHAQSLLDHADVIAALSIDGLQGSIQAFDPDLHDLKAHAGQVQSAKSIRSLLKGSGMLKAHEDCDRVQDAYSLRCAAQVHGACRQTLSHVVDVVSRELQSVTDNPIVFADQDKVISGGHFHGQALSFAMDYLAMGMAELCNISERRVTKLLNPTFSRLPAFLAKASGLHSGLMIAQYTSASLVSENKVLSHPASVDSVSTSNDKEDHVSMGPIAGRKLAVVIENTYHCLAIEALCAAEAMEFHRPLQSSEKLERIHSEIRKACPVANEDRYLAKDMAQVRDLLLKRSFLDVLA